jgi:hypothetical protein
MDLFKKKTNKKKTNERVRASEKEKRDISLSLSLSLEERARLSKKRAYPTPEKRSFRGRSHRSISLFGFRERIIRAYCIYFKEEKRIFFPFVRDKTLFVSVGGEEKTKVKRHGRRERRKDKRNPDEEEKRRCRRRLTKG